MTGLSFGLTSGIISTLGVLVGVEAATSSKLAVVSAITVMAVADGLADATGIHLSEETENQHSAKEIWLSTVFTFLGVCGFTLTFIIPVLFLSFPCAIWVSIVWGLGLLSLFSFYLGRIQSKNPLKIILEHDLVAVIIIIVSYGLGILLKTFIS